MSATEREGGESREEEELGRRRTSLEIKLRLKHRPIPTRATPPTPPPAALTAATAATMRGCATSPGGAAGRRERKVPPAAELRGARARALEDGGEHADLERQAEPERGPAAAARTARASARSRCGHPRRERGLVQRGANRRRVRRGSGCRQRGEAEADAAADDEERGGGGGGGVAAAGERGGGERVGEQRLHHSGRAARGAAVLGGDQRARVAQRSPRARMPRALHSRCCVRAAGTPTSTRANGRDAVGARRKLRVGAAHAEAQADVDVLGAAAPRQRLVEAQHDGAAPPAASSSSAAAAAAPSPSSLARSPPDGGGSAASASRAALPPAAASGGRRAPRRARVPAGGGEALEHPTAARRHRPQRA